MSFMLDMLEKEINNLNVYEGNIPEIVTAIANSIPSQTIPYRMKLALAVSEIMLFTSQFRCNIKHWNDSIIPINAITFCVAKSGACKDSSVKAARKCFEEGYNIINEKRKELAINEAIKEAEKEGCEVPDLFSNYKHYYYPPNPLFVAISTPEGFIQHLNDLSKGNIGAGYIYSGEIGAELSSNMNIIENIKILAELYDEGSKEVKIIKARENQSKEVKNLPVSSLFIGSQDNLLYEDNIKKRFKTEFTTKLARRSFFIFVKEDMERNKYSSIDEMLKQEHIIEDEAKRNRKEVSDYIKELTDALLYFSEDYIKVSDKVRDLFILYKKYNEELASTIDNQYPISKLTRNHLQWKALKLSGAFALIEGLFEIKEEHYKAAIEFVELINNDISEFEKELVKEPYELFATYCREYAINNEWSISLHELRKTGFIPMKGQSESALKELVKLVSSYDNEAIYTLKDNTIYFKLLEKTNEIKVSYVPCTGSKEARYKKCSEGYICEECKFSDLEELLQGDFAYTPYKFKNGVRGRDNIDSGCKWIVLDIDSSEITDKEAHMLLSDINHFIVRTSNPDNEYKFRILIELDIEIDIPDIQWKHFISTLSKDLGLKADILPKSQIFYSYSNRIILSQLDCEPLEVKPYLDLLNLEDKQIDKVHTPNECKQLLSNPLYTFHKAYEAKDGEGSRRLIWAARYAKELGATKEYVLNLVNEINNYWSKPLEEQRFNNTIINQINRWSFY